MASLKQQDCKAYGEIQKFFREQLEINADLGYPLRGEWSGYRAIGLYTCITTGIGLSGEICQRSRIIPAARMTRSFR